MAESQEKEVSEAAEKVINPEDHKKIFENLQGNILKGHGRNYSRCIFFRLNEPGGKPDPEARAAFRACLVRLANDYITSAWKQHLERENYREFGTPGAIFVSLFLTAKGYEKLGVDRTELRTLPHATEYFLAGMGDDYSRGELKDPPLETWEEGYYKKGRIDAMILLADDDEAFLERVAGQLMTELREFAEILAYERGNVLRKGGLSVEHFGYVDGLSQPIFLSTDSDLPEKGDMKNWDPTASPDLVLVQDKLVKDKDCFGSYLVFRKLEQDVVGFEHGKGILAEQFGLGLKESDRQQAGAMLVGRFEEGTPIERSDKALSRPGGEPPDNDFRYEDNPRGPSCPVFAHTRITNPRPPKGAKEEKDERMRRIARRGIPYGKRAFWDRLPTEPVGLLFMCFQRNIDDQFAHIQKRANEKNDSIIGQAPDLADPPDRLLPRHLEERRIERRRDLAQGMPQDSLFAASWVKLRGGEFFFAPSVPFLKGLNAKS